MVETGIFTTGSIKLNNSSGSADLSIPISGPDGKATLHVVAEKTAGSWTFSTITVEVKGGGERIDLMDAHHGQDPSLPDQPVEAE